MGLKTMKTKYITLVTVVKSESAKTKKELSKVAKTEVLANEIKKKAKAAKKHQNKLKKEAAAKKKNDKKNIKIQKKAEAAKKKIVKIIKKKAALVKKAKSATGK